MIKSRITKTSSLFRNRSMKINLFSIDIFEIVFEIFDCSSRFFNVGLQTFPSSSIPQSLIYIKIFSKLSGEQSHDFIKLRFDVLWFESKLSHLLFILNTIRALLCWIFNLRLLERFSLGLYMRRVSHRLIKLVLYIFSPISIYQITVFSTFHRLYARLCIWRLVILFFYPSYLVPQILSGSMFTIARFYPILLILGVVEVLIFVVEV